MLRQRISLFQIFMCCLHLPHSLLLLACYSVCLNFMFSFLQYSLPIFQGEREGVVGVGNRYWFYFFSALPIQRYVNFNLTLWKDSMKQKLSLPFVILDSFIPGPKFWKAFIPLFPPFSLICYHQSLLIIYTSNLELELPPDPRPAQLGTKNSLCCIVLCKSWWSIK